MNPINAGIVTYNPDLNKLKENIDAIISQVDFLLIVDNGSLLLEEIIELIKKYEKVQLIENKENLGIACALNQIMYSDYFKKSDWILLLDQDSLVPKNMIEEYRRYLNLDKVAIVCPIIYDLNSGLNRHEVGKVGGNFTFINHCITSGSLFLVAAWKEIKGADEELFIDYVDDDLSIRTYNYGYKIVRANNVIMDHEIGKKSKHFFFTTYNHTAFRKYYMTRNTIYCAYKYSAYAKKKYSAKKERVEYIKKFNYMPSVKHAYLKVLKRLVIVVLYENDKKNKMKGIMKGIRDAKKMRLSNLRH